MASPTEQLVKEKGVCRTSALASQGRVERVEMKYLIRDEIPNQRKKTVQRTIAVSVYQFSIAADKSLQA